MKDKIVTLICSVLCLMIFASACTGDVWTAAREATAPVMMPLVREDPEPEPAPPPAVSPTPPPEPTPVSAPVIKCKKTPRKKCSFVAEVRKKR